MEPVNPVAPPRKKRTSQVVEYGYRSSKNASTVMVESSNEKQPKPRKSVSSSVFDLDAFSGTSIAYKLKVKWVWKGLK